MGLRVPWKPFADLTQKDIVNGVIALEFLRKGYGLGVSPSNSPDLQSTNGCPELILGKEVLL